MPRQEHVILRADMHTIICMHALSRIWLLRVYAAAGACYITYHRYHAISRVGLLRVYAAAGAEVGELERVVDNEDVLRLRRAHITVIKTSIASRVPYLSSRMRMFSGCAMRIR